MQQNQRFHHHAIMAGITTITVIALGMLSGCAISDNWNKPLGQHGFSEPLGEAHHQQLEAQKFNPVPATTDPVVNMDGRLAQRTIKTYQQPEPEDKGPSFNEVMQFMMKDKK